MLQASVNNPAPSTIIKALPYIDVLALQQLLPKPEMAFAVQLHTSRNGFNALLYQAHMPSIISLHCSCCMGHWIARHIIIHCRNSPAARHAHRDNQGCLPVYRQLVTTLTNLKEVTQCVLIRRMLGQYQRATGLLYPPEPPVEGAGASLRAESCSFYCFLLFAGLCFVLLFY